MVVTPVVRHVVVMTRVMAIVVIARMVVAAWCSL